MTVARLFIVPVVVASMQIALHAQQARPSFEVASIKKLDTPQSGSFSDLARMRGAGGVFYRTNITLVGLVQFAYELPDYRVVGGPDWVRTDLFEVNAKAETDVPPAQLRLMVQWLLGDRFGLAIHREPREMRFLALVLAHSDGHPGPYLHRMPDAPATCTRQEVDAIEKTRPKPSSGYGMAGTSCGSMASLAELASKLVGTPVIDTTGLTGRWSLMLYYAPDRNLGTLQIGTAPDPNLPSLPAALQEQAGLKLEPARGPVDVLVIDSVMQPTEN